MADQLSPDRPIVFFDGVCGLCNASVDRMLKWDHSRVLRFAPLQGSTAAQLLPSAFAKDFDTFVLMDEQGMHLRSDAAIRALVHFGGVWRIAAVMRVVPRPLRDAVYAWVSRNRYRWFGKRDACRLPTPQERERFLP
jgi:predicted DCC family thiol-disulfide oxidoreductase YuxK